MGMNVEGTSFYGYDRRHNKYTLVGFDTSGTYYITASGDYDAETKTLTLKGTDEDPIAGITQVYEFQHKFIDEDTHTISLTFHCPTFGADGPHKLMEITLKRNKS